MKYIFLIKYIKSVLWRVAKRLSFIQNARCLKVKQVSLKAHTYSRMTWNYLLYGKIIYISLFAPHQIHRH